MSRSLLVASRMPRALGPLLAAALLAGCGRAPVPVPAPAAAPPAPPLECAPNLGDCDHDPANGCETDVTRSPSHCGRCGHDCLGGECRGSLCRPVTLVTEEQCPSGLAADAENVYWTATGEGAVKKLPRRGGWRVALASGRTRPQPIALSADHVYWAGIQGHVARVRKGGGAVETLATGVRLPSAIAVDTEAVYWTDRLAGTVTRAPLKGGAPEVLAASQREPTGLALGDSWVFWTNNGGGTVATVPKRGGRVELLATDQARPRSIAVAGGVAYWINEGGAQGSLPNAFAWDDGALQRAASALEIETLVKGAYNIRGLAVDRSRVFYWTGTEGSLVAVPLSGGEASTLATGVASPASMFADATALYWTDCAGGTVMMLAK